VKQLLIVFGILIVAAYLFTSPPSSVESRVTSAPPAQAEREARAPLRSSWGASLGALKNNAEAPAVKGDSSSEPNRSSRMDREELVRRSPAVTQAVVQPAPSLPSEDVALKDSPKWVTLTQPVRFRTDPNVTSPGPLYPAGSKAKILGSNNGWLELLDPTTKERGWVSHIFVASTDAPKEGELQAASASDANVADRRKVQRRSQVASEQESEGRSQVAQAASIPTRDQQDIERRSNEAKTIQVKPTAQVRDTNPAFRASVDTRAKRRGGLFNRRDRARGLFRLRRQPPAWTLGPAR
jgi:hypothetical protein